MAKKAKKVEKRYIAKGAGWSKEMIFDYISDVIEGHDDIAPIKISQLTDKICQAFVDFELQVQYGDEADTREDREELMYNHSLDVARQLMQQAPRRKTKKRK